MFGGRPDKEFIGQSHKFSSVHLHLHLHLHGYVAVYQYWHKRNGWEESYASS